PPVRDRREDIPLLVIHFLEGTGKTVSPELMKMLVAYDWPGNVRELENEVKKLVLLAADKEVIEPEVASGRISAAGSGNGNGTAALPAAGDLEFSRTYSLYDYIAGLEKRFIEKALRETGGVKKHAAAALNIPESTLRLKIKQYGIRMADFTGHVSA
ncbi:MAG: helix-turn-helix domain-containing protein, partial [Candidatus Zixiibacteriota bacterium]